MRIVTSLVFSQCQRRHRRRNIRSPAAKVQALRGARLKALLALDFCLGRSGHSCNSFILVHISGTARVFHPGKEYQRGLSCNSPDSQYANTDMCGDTPAARCRQNEGTCTRNHTHKYLWKGIHCQVNCTSALLDFVPCNVDVGTPIWAGRYMAETAEEISEDDGVDCEDIREVQMSGETFQDDGGGL